MVANEHENEYDRKYHSRGERGLRSDLAIQAPELACGMARRSNHHPGQADEVEVFEWFGGDLPVAAFYR